jgi:methionine sulfoxide reductase catalytic subunit
MLIKTHNDGFNHLLGSEITPQGIYTGRRDLMKLMAGGVAGAAMASLPKSLAGWLLIS